MMKNESKRFSKRPLKRRLELRPSENDRKSSLRRLGTKSRRRKRRSKPRRIEKRSCRIKQELRSSRERRKLRTSPPCSRGKTVEEMRTASNWLWPVLLQASPSHFLKTARLSITSSSETSKT